MVNQKLHERQVASSGDPQHPWPLATPRRISPPASVAKLIVESTIFGAIYAAIFLLSKGYFFPELYQQAIWPISGLTLAAFAGSTKDRWLGYTLAIATADLTCRMMVCQGEISLILPSTALCLTEPLLSAWLLHRLAGDVFQLSSPRRLFELIAVGALGSPFVSAVIGAALIQSTTTEPIFATALFSWWTSNCMGVLVVAPVVLSWVDRTQQSNNYFPNWLTLLEFVGWQAISMVISVLVFGPPQPGLLRVLQFPISLMPLFFCISLRFGLRGISTSILLFLFPTIYGTAAGYGYVASVFPNPTDQVWAIQRFVAVLTCTINILAILLEQQRRTTRMLREQAQLLTSIINSTANGILVKDLDNRYLLANQSGAEMLGTTINKMIGRYSQELLQPEHQETILKLDQEVIDTGTAKQLEVTSTINDEQRVLKLQVSPLRNAFSDVTGVIVFAEDITTERNAQQSLANSERRFRNYAASSPVGLFELDREGFIIYSNQRMCDLTGLTQKEILSREIAKRIHPEDLDTLEATWQQFRASSVDWIELSYRIRHPDGRVTHLIAPTTALRNEAKEITGYIGSAIDVSLQKGAERELYASRERFRTLAEGAPIGIFELDLSSCCTFVNEEWSTITGLSHEQGLGLNWLTAIHPDDREAVSQRVFHSIKNLQPEYEHETRLLRPDGTIAWIVVRMSIVRGDGHAVTGYIGTITDITLQMEARKHLEEANEILEQRVKERTSELERANALLNTEMSERARAEDRLRMKQAALSHVLRVSTLGELTTELTHELNQPLHAISTYAGGLLRRANHSQLSPQDIIKPVQQIVVEANRAAELIRRTRTFAVRRETHLQSMNVVDAIREAIGLLAFEARQRSITVETNLPAYLPPVMADAVQIQQVLVNLIRNAFDSVSSPGAIAPRVAVSAVIRHSVMVGPVPPKDEGVPIKPETSLDGCSHVEIQVRDFGTGLTSELLEKAFDPFISSKPDGLGLGLTISRSIADAHRGRLTAENLPDGGAIFRFLIPYSEESLP